MYATLRKQGEDKPIVLRDITNVIVELGEGSNGRFVKVAVSGMVPGTDGKRTLGSVDYLSKPGDQIRFFDERELNESTGTTRNDETFVATEFAPEDLHLVNPTRVTLPPLTEEQYARAEAGLDIGERSGETYADPISGLEMAEGKEIESSAPRPE